MSSVSLRLTSWQRAVLAQIPPVGVAAVAGAGAGGLGLRGCVLLGLVPGFPRDPSAGLVRSGLGGGGDRRRPTGDPRKGFRDRKRSSAGFYDSVVEVMTLSHQVTSTTFTSTQIAGEGRDTTCLRARLDQVAWHRGKTRESRGLRVTMFGKGQGTSIPGGHRP